MKPCEICGKTDSAPMCFDCALAYSELTAEEWRDFKAFMRAEGGALDDPDSAPYVLTPKGWAEVNQSSPLLEARP